MLENVSFALVFFPSVAAVVIFSMKYVASIVQARSRLAQDEAYRELAMKNASVQAETAATLASYGTTLSEIQTRLTSVEKILKEVG